MPYFESVEDIGFGFGNSFCSPGLAGGGCSKLMPYFELVKGTGYVSGFAFDGNFGSGPYQFADFNSWSKPYPDDSDGGLSSGTSCHSPSPSCDWDHWACDCVSPDTPVSEEDVASDGLGGSFRSGSDFSNVLK